MLNIGVVHFNINKFTLHVKWHHSLYVFGLLIAMNMYFEHNSKHFDNFRQHHNLPCSAYYLPAPNKCIMTNFDGASASCANSN